MNSTREEKIERNISSVHLFIVQMATLARLNSGIQNSHILDRSQEPWLSAAFPGTLGKTESWIRGKATRIASKAAVCEASMLMAA